MAGIKVFCDTEFSIGEKLLLPHAEAHHLTRVLRLQPGENLFVLNGRGVIARGVFEKLNQAIYVHILEIETHTCLRPKIILIQAMPMGKIMDDIIRQSVEIGVFAIFPIYSERVQFRLDEVRAHNRHERWLNIAREACKQSHNPYLPILHPVMSIKEALNMVSGEDHQSLSLVASLESDAQPLIQVLSSIAEEVILLIGPEGDFTAAEYISIKHHGFKPVRLTTNILRAETAALYGLSAVHAHYNLLG